MNNVGATEDEVREEEQGLAPDRVDAWMVDQAEDTARGLRDEYLRDTGWAYTDDHPGQLWLWSKQILTSDLRAQNTGAGVRLYVCNAELAAYIQEALDGYKRG